MQPMSFGIAAIETFHATEMGRAYWRSSSEKNRAASDRFVLKSGWRAAYGRHFETAIIKVTLDDGTVGWGEATEPVCPEVICRLAVELVAPFVGGRTHEHPAMAWDDGYD
jgi:galactonate dehydratase